jgi:hypothetical protein
MTQTITTPPAADDTTGSVRPITLAVLGAAAVNVVLYLAFKAAGADYENTQLAEPVAIANVLFMTVPALLVGMTAVALLSLRWRSLLTVGRWVGVALALATIAMTATAGFETLSFVALALMHVVVAIAVYAGLGAIKR